MSEALRGLLGTCKLGWAFKDFEKKSAQHRSVIFGDVIEEKESRWSSNSFGQEKIGFH